MLLNCTLFSFSLSLTFSFSLGMGGVCHFVFEIPSELFESFGLGAAGTVTSYSTSVVVRSGVRLGGGRVRKVILVISISMNHVFFLDPLSFPLHFFRMLALELLIIVGMGPDGTRWACKGINEEIVVGGRVVLTDPTFGEGTEHVFHRLAG